MIIPSLQAYEIVSSTSISDVTAKVMKLVKDGYHIKGELIVTETYRMVCGGTRVTDPLYTQVMVK